MMRDVLKACARAAAAIVVVPALVSYWIKSSVLGADRALESSSQALAILPGVVGEYVRRAFLARVLAHCHHTATISWGTLFSQTGARLDENVYIGPSCHIGLAHLERNVLLGSGVHVPSGPATHGTAVVDVPIRDQSGQRTMVRIGAGSWIGNGAIVLADVGRDTVVGAGAVVTHPLPDRVVAAGVPSRVLRARQ
jgi:virginiamycin A acetyltransferase